MAILTSTAIAIAGLAVAAVGTTVAIKQGKEAEKRGKEQDRIAKANSTAESISASRKSNRESRIARARITQGGINSGTKQSSAVTGGESGIESQNAAAQANIVGSQSRALQSVDSAAAQRAAVQRGKNATSVAGLGVSIFNAAGGFGAFKGSNSGVTPKVQSQAPAIAGGQLDSNLSIFQNTVPQ